MIKITPNFVDSLFEEEVMKLVPHQEQNGKGRNQVIRYGNKDVSYLNVVSSQIPDVFLPLQEHIKFDSVTINEYMPGQEITWHTDRRTLGDVISVISLLSDAEIHFRLNHHREKHLLPRYSLVQFGGEKRYKWEHYLKAKDKRYSIVLRNSEK